MRLSIVVGHSQKNSGANGVAPISMHEYPFNKQIADMMVEYAVRTYALPVKVFYRDDIGRKGVTSAVNRWCGGDRDSCSIELHFNATVGHEAQGTETLYALKSSEPFADAIHEAVVALFNREWKTDRGVTRVTDGDRGYSNLSWLIKCGGSCLVEPAFGDNPHDATLLWNKREDYAKTLVDAAYKWLSKSKDPKLTDKGEQKT